MADWNCVPILIGNFCLLNTKETKCRSNCNQKRGVRICERKNYAKTKVSKEAWGGVSPDTKADIPLHGEDYGEAGCSPAARGS